MADKKTAAGFWAPRLETTSTHAHYDLSPQVPSVLVHGAYLVRSATVQGSHLVLTGDTNSTTTLDVFAPDQVTSISWNGVALRTSRSEIGSLRASVAFPHIMEATIPRLEDQKWVCADSLPELAANFDDRDWVQANKTTTFRPQKPTAGKVCSSSQDSQLV